MVTDIISPMLKWFVFKLKGEKISNIILYCLGYFIVLFGSLIYNEIIICNFFGFNKNTKKCLEERQDQESFLLKKTEKLIKSGNLVQTEISMSQVSEDSVDSIEDENENIKK